MCCVRYSERHFYHFYLCVCWIPTLHIAQHTDKSQAMLICFQFGCEHARCVILQEIKVWRHTWHRQLYKSDGDILKILAVEPTRDCTPPHITLTLYLL